MSQRQSTVANRSVKSRAYSYSYLGQFRQYTESENAAQFILLHQDTLGMMREMRIPSVISAKVMRASCTIQNIIRIQTSALIANPSKWPNTLKQFFWTSCLSVFDHFVVFLWAILFQNPRPISINNFNKKRLQRRHFPVKFVKLLRTSVLKNSC